MDSYTLHFRRNIDAFSREECCGVYDEGNISTAEGISLPPDGLFDLLIDYQLP
jgi:hypothetical protein